MKLKRFSVLLLYPDYVAEDYGHETYYTWVMAFNSVDAVRRAQRRVAKIHENNSLPNDYYPLLVIRGFRRGLETE